MTVLNARSKVKKHGSVLIVGSGGAGAVAAVYAQRTKPDADITVVTREHSVAYRKPAIVKIIEGQAPDMKGIILGDLIMEDGRRAYFKQRYSALAKERIRVLRETEVTSLDMKRQAAKIIRKATGDEDEIRFDSVVLATGATATKPNIDGAHLPGTFTMWSASEAQKLLDELKTANRALVVGVGFVGLETTEILVKMGIETFVAVRSRLLRTLVEPDLSEIIMAHLRSEGVNFIQSARIERIEGKSHVKSVRINGKSMPFDMVIFAAGARPNVQLGTAIGCNLEGRAYRVNNYMETTVPKVYAAGNCAAYFDGILQRYLYLPVVRLAAYQGQIAGTNAAGGKIADEGFVKGQIDHIAGLQIASIGHSSEVLKGLNLPFKVFDVSEHFTMFSGANKPEVRFVVGEKERLLGAQVIREQFIGELAFLLYEAINQGKSMSQVLREIDSPLSGQASSSGTIPYIERVLRSR
ncbi:MAG: NAD(P)/FAD-dependent oxidoreductase [Candidatus Ranarchaeia archaeon]